MFFYEETTTLRDQLRSIVQKYENLAKDEFSATRQKGSQDRSRSTSLDTKERLKAFINRQDVMNRQSAESSKLNALSTKETPKQAHDSDIVVTSKEDFDEIDLKNSIHSID